MLWNHEAGERSETLPALLDTGSDGTLVPLYLLRDIRAPMLQEARMRSHWGEWRTVGLFLVEMTIGALTFAGVLVVGDDQGDEIILGRNILNKIRLELDGPSLQTRIPAQ